MTDLHPMEAILTRRGIATQVYKDHLKSCIPHEPSIWYIDHQGDVQYNPNANAFRHISDVVNTRMGIATGIVCPVDWFIVGYDLHCRVPSILRSSAIQQLQIISTHESLLMCFQSS